MRAALGPARTSCVPVRSSRIAAVPHGLRASRPSFLGATSCLSARGQRADRRRRANTVVAQARSFGVDGASRVVAALPYILPFLDSFSYARFLFFQFPEIGRIIVPIVKPMLSLYASIPFASLIFFFGIYLGIVRNLSFSRFVRFNGMQAILMDILLVLPRLIENILSAPTGGVALQAYIWSYNTIWVGVAACVAYTITQCFLGQWAYLPFLGEAADKQV